MSTVARDFARVAASHFDKPTLLLDLDWAGDGQWRYFSQPALVERLGPLSDPLDLGFDGSALIRVATHDVRRAKASITFHQVGATPLLVSRFHTDSADRRQVPQVTSNQAIWKQLRDRVGFVVVDSPAASTSFDGVAISGVMDAVVIVIEAETTRVPVIEDLRDKLMARGPMWWERSSTSGACTFRRCSTSACSSKRRRLGAGLLGVLGALWASVASAQVPPPPGIYILGHDIGRDGVAATETIQPDGRPDLWMRMTLRNLGYYIGPRSGGYYVTHFILRTKAPPFRQWDTIPGNGHPLLEIIRDGHRVNRFDGSVNGYNPRDTGFSTSTSPKTRHWNCATYPWR